MKRWDEWKRITRESIEHLFLDTIREEGIDPDSDLGRLITEELRRRATTPRQVAQMARKGHIEAAEGCSECWPDGGADTRKETIPEGSTKSPQASIDRFDDPVALEAVLKWFHQAHDSKRSTN